MRPVLASMLAAAALVGGCGTDEADDAAPPAPVTVTVTETETETETETRTVPSEPEVSCSTAGLRATLPDQDLPPDVAEVRQRVFDAAVACDYDTLEAIAEEKGEGFTFSYGAADDASEYWAEAETSGEEPKPMRSLVAILAMPFTRNESGSYAWPTAYSESPTPEAWQALVDAGLYPEDVVEQMRTQGTGYLGYRTAITPDGDWQFFVAGD